MDDSIIVSENESFNEFNCNGGEIKKYVVYNPR